MLERIKRTTASRYESRTGVAAILAGVLIFAGQAGELAFGNALDPLWVALFVLGIAALVMTIWGLRGLVSTRIGRIGWRVSVAGVVLLGLFAVQAVVTVALTGDIPENFVLFALGFLLLFLGQLAIAPGLRDTLGLAWMLPLVGAAGLLVAITLEVDPVHDIGLFVFEGAWVALGVALLRLEGPRGRRQVLDSAGNTQPDRFSVPSARRSSEPLASAAALKTMEER